MVSSSTNAPWCRSNHFSCLSEAQLEVKSGRINILNFLFSLAFLDFFYFITFSSLTLLPFTSTLLSPSLCIHSILPSLEWFSSARWNRGRLLTLLFQKKKREKSFSFLKKCCLKTLDHIHRIQEYMNIDHHIVGQLQPTHNRYTIL